MSERVLALTEKRQTPTTAKPSTVPDFLLGTVPVPLHRRWWFWSAVGLVTAAAVSGILLGTEPWTERPQQLVF